ncbi:Nudix hydrolase domain-containing protein [Mycena venus]|uniref:Nudix hydrolase domain-containing protein n=1 Tax=Mycena venus TaxID=2733690 RepID=A0A8H7DFR9_9AGAR|nr:Nudix hydrolase domain-containing protein [Mycena venus]
MGSRSSLVAQPPQRPARTSTQQTPGNGNQPRRNFLNPFLQQPKPMSQWSSPQVPDSGWADENFLLGAAMVVFQPATLKVVVLHETKKKYWFLPKGRKDVGESLEQTALREAYEESGYRVEFLPLYTQTHAPGPPSNPQAPYGLNSEPIYISTAAYPARIRRNRIAPAGEYLTFWQVCRYVGQIPEDAVREEGTGMPDEVNYEAHLMDVNDAMKHLFHDEAHIVKYAWELFDWTRRIMEKERNKQNASESVAPPAQPDSA